MKAVLYRELEISYGSLYSSGLTIQAGNSVNITNNQEHGRFLDHKGEVLFKLVDHSEVEFGFVAQNRDS